MNIEFRTGLTWGEGPFMNWQRQPASSVMNVPFCRFQLSKRGPGQSLDENNLEYLLPVISLLIAKILQILLVPE